MNSKGVIDKILADAQAQANQIKAHAADEQADEQAEHERIVADFKNQTDTIAKKAAEDEKLHVLAAARMQVSRELLAEKRVILDKVFIEARKRLIGMDDDAYRGLFTKLIVEAAETGDEEVIVDKNEKRIDRNFVKNVNRELGPGFRGNLRLSEKKANIGAGFILSRGDIKKNVSADVLISQARKDLEIELAKQLFVSD